MRIPVVIGTVLLALFSAAPSGAATIHVNCAHANLQNKINAAPAGSTLEIEGTCVGQFTISKNLKLVGDPKATLDGNGGGTTLTIDTTSVVLAHLVVTGGRLSGGVQAFGPGINATNSHVTLRHAVVWGNFARATGDAGQAVIALGGGILSSGGSLMLVHSVVRGNTVIAQAGMAQAFGGGIERNGSVTIVGSTIKNNKAVATSKGTSALSQGGGLLIDEGDLLVKSSTFVGNAAKVTGSAGPMTAEGGGIYLSDSFGITLERTIVAGNLASVASDGIEAHAHGGGMAGALTAGTFVKTDLFGNRASASSTHDAEGAGGAAALQAGSQGVRLTSSWVSANLADAHGAGLVNSTGGGFEVGSGKLILQRSTVRGNEALSPAGAPTSASGGGLAVEDQLVVSNSTVSHNVASATGGLSLGGGIVLPSVGPGPSSLTNSTIAKNKAQGSTARGGGIDTATELHLTSSTVAFNAAKIGGGLYVEQPTTTLLATIVAGNSAPDSPQCSGPIESGGWNLISSTAQCVFNSKASDRLNTAAKLGELGNHGGPTQTVPIQATSPAKNAIRAASCPVGRDQRGVKRPQGRRCDIGAFERKL